MCCNLLRMIRVLLFGCCILGFGKGHGSDNPASFSLKVQRLTSGPSHHLFGYIGQSLTVPWNASSRYVVALRTDFHNRLPGAEDAAEVVLVDMQNQNKTIILDLTRGWNLQQGSMLYWNPLQPETQFFFNDRDPKDGRVFTVLYDIKQRVRVKEYRYQGGSIGNSGVAPKGGFFAAINYGRLARLRPVTGYAGAMDETDGVRAPENDGIFIINVESEEVRLIVSFKELLSLLQSAPAWELIGKRWTPAQPSDRSTGSLDLSEASLYLNHTLISRDNERIYFFVRGRVGTRSLWLNAPCSIKTNGSELTLHTTSIGGHPEWAEGSLMIGAHEGRQVVYDVLSQKIISTRALGNSAIFPVPEGDISLSPDGRWFVNGYSSEDRQTISYVVMDLLDGTYARSDPFDRGPYTKGDLRTDPSPRWNRESDALLVPGWTKDGTRQLHVIHIETHPKVID